MLSSHFIKASIIVKRQQKSTIKKLNWFWFVTELCTVPRDNDTSANLLVVSATTAAAVSVCHHDIMILGICTVVSLNSYSQIKLLRAGRNSTWVIFRQIVPRNFLQRRRFLFVAAVEPPRTPLLSRVSAVAPAKTYRNLAPNQVMVIFHNYFSQ